jgi:hypothetical protein
MLPYYIHLLKQWEGTKTEKVTKAVPLHAMEALEGREDIVTY